MLTFVAGIFVGMLLFMMLSCLMYDKDEDDGNDYD